MKKNQVFRVKKNVQIFCSTGIPLWKGGAHGPRIEWRSTNERRECWKVFTVYWHRCCSSFSPSCRLVAHLPAQVQLQPVLLAQSGLKGTVDTRGSLSQGKTVQNDEPWGSFTNIHLCILIVYPVHAMLSRSLTHSKHEFVPFNCSWRCCRTSKIRPHHRKETPRGAEAVEVGGAKISPSRNLALLQQFP